MWPNWDNKQRRKTNIVKNITECENFNPNWTILIKKHAIKAEWGCVKEIQNKGLFTFKKSQIWQKMGFLKKFHGKHKWMSLYDGSI